MSGQATDTPVPAAYLLPTHNPLYPCWLGPASSRPELSRPLTPASPEAKNYPRPNPPALAPLLPQPRRPAVSGVSTGLSRGRPRATLPGGKVKGRAPTTATERGAGESCTAAPGSAGPAPRRGHANNPDGTENVSNSEAMSLRGLFLSFLVQRIQFVDL